MSLLHKLIAGGDAVLDLLLVVVEGLRLLGFPRNRRQQQEGSTTVTQPTQADPRVVSLIEYLTHIEDVAELVKRQGNPIYGDAILGDLENIGKIIDELFLGGQPAPRTRPTHVPSTPPPGPPADHPEWKLRKATRADVWHHRATHDQYNQGEEVWGP